MESIQDDSTNSSSEEVDQPQQDNSNNNNDDVGTGRFYECVFCKRGFNTAQALGGHMNIHRKDRAKNRPSSLINSRQREEIYTGPRISHQSSSYPPYYSEADHDEAARANYRTYIPASTSAAAVRPSYMHHGGDFNDRSPQPFNTFGDDWRSSLSLQFGPPDEEDKDKKGDVESEEDDLDLELRLGHNP